MTDKQALRKQGILLFSLIAALTGLAATAQAQEQPMKWVATSGTAASITGDIKISPDKLIMAGADYPLTLVHDVDAQHLSDVGKVVSVTKPTKAHLYKIKIPAAVKLLQGNTLCGAKDANWLITVTGSSPPYQNDQSLSLAFFSGDSEPSLDYNVVSKSTDLCGTFMYGR